MSQFHSDERYQILSAYAQDGIVLSRVFRGSTDATVFEDFISQLLRHCGRWPEPKSVLLMDNVSFHHSKQIAQICADAGVKLAYLRPYSEDLNPILSSDINGVAMKIISVKNLTHFSSGVLMWLMRKKSARGRLCVSQGHHLFRRT